MAYNVCSGRDLLEKICIVANHYLEEDRYTAIKQLQQGEKMSQQKKTKIGGIMRSTNLAMIGVMSAPDRPGVAGALLDCLGRNNINVQFIVQCIDLNKCDDVVLCVSEDDLDEALTLLAGVKEEIEAKGLVHGPNVGIVSIFGPDFRHRPAIAGTMFLALASVGINILAISTSISTVSCVIEAHRLADAVEILDQTFELP